MLDRVVGIIPVSRLGTVRLILCRRSGAKGGIVRFSGSIECRSNGRSTTTERRVVGFHLDFGEGHLG